MIHSTWDAPSHSRLACVLSCERKYFNKYILGLESPDQFPPAYMGQAMHVALEHWHRTGDSSGARTALDIAWGGQRFYGDWAWVSPGHADIVLQHYLESKHTQDWEIVKLRRSDLDASRLLETDVQEDSAGFLVMAEASFVVNVPGMGPVNVRPDVLLKTPSGLRVVDHKTTTAYLGAKLYNRTKFEHQLRLYALAFSALLGQPVLEGACNAIYSGFNAGTVNFKGKRFEFYPFDYSPADFEETKAWYRSGVEKMRYMQENFTQHDELSAPQNPGDHCGYCDYGKLCSAPAALRPGLVKINYKRKVA